MPSQIDDKPDQDLQINADPQNVEWTNQGNLGLKAKEVETSWVEFEANPMRAQARQPFYTEKELAEFAENLMICGPSPDEIALLEATKKKFRFFFTGSDSHKVIVQAAGVKIEIEKLLFNGFDSVRKMMSVLVKFNDKGGPNW